MSITFKRVLAIALVATSVGAVMLPRETIAQDAHHLYAPRAAHSYSQSNAYDYVTSPADSYLARPLPRYIRAKCDVARDWNC
jgi:hypothetical protein